MSEETKTCSCCGVVKGLVNFYSAGKNLQSRCKLCSNEARRNDYKNNPEKYKTRLNNWQKRSSVNVADIKRRSHRKNYLKNYLKAKARRKADPARHQTYDKIWRMKNPDRVAEIQGNYRSSHRSEIKEKLVGNASDAYLAAIIGIPVTELRKHPEFIESYRARLLLKRKISKLKKPNQ